MITGIDKSACDDLSNERLVNALKGSQAARVWYEFIRWRNANPGPGGDLHDGAVRELLAERDC